MANNKNDIKVSYKLINNQFTKAIAEVNKEITTVNKNFRLQQEQLRLSGSATDKLGLTLENLNKKYELARKKTEETRKALENAKATMGANSQEARTWTNKLLDAERAEASLKNRIVETTSKLEEATKAEEANSGRIKERTDALKFLENEESNLKNQTELLTAEYNANAAALGNNATEAKKNALENKYLYDSYKLAKEEVGNLEAQLEIAKEQFGENSQEVHDLQVRLAEARETASDFSNRYANVGNTLHNVTQHIQKGGKALESFGKTYTKYISTMLVAGIGATVKSASDWEKAFVQIKKTNDEVVDANGNVSYSYAQLEEDVKSLSKELPINRIEIAEVAAAAGQLGIKTEDVAEFTRTMTELGIATNLSSEEAATAIAQLANNMGMTSEEYHKFGSALVDLGNNSATTEKNILNMTQRIGASAHMYGIATPKVLALASSLASAGIEAEAGGTALNNLMAKMDKGSAVAESYERNLAMIEEQYGDNEKEMNKQIDALNREMKSINALAKTSGVSAKEFAETWKKDPVEAIKMFEQGIAKANKEGININQILAEVGVNSVNEINAVKTLANGIDKLDGAIIRSGDAWNKNNAATEEAAKQKETLQAKIILLKNEFQDMMDKVGKPFADMLLDMLEAIKPVVEQISKLAKKFSEASPETQKFIMKMTFLAVAIGPLLTIMGKAIMLFGMFSEAMVVARTGAAATGPAVKGLSLIFSGIGKAVTAILPIITSALSSIMGAVMACIQGIIGLIVAHPIAAVIVVALIAIVAIWRKYGDKIKAWWAKHWKEIKEGAKKGFDGLKKGLNVFLSKRREMIDKSNKAIKQVLTKAWDGIKNGFKTFFKVIGDVNATKLRLLKETTTNTWNGIKNGVSSVWNGMLNTAKNVFDNIKNVIQGVWNTITTLTTTTWNTITNIVSGTVGRLGGVVSGAFNGIRNTVSSVWNGISNVTTSVWNNIKNTISNSLNGVLGVARSVLNSIKNLFSTLELRLPRPKFPHFHWEGSFNLMPLEIPHLRFDGWFAKGGIANRGPAVAGIGEAGPEAIVPLSGSNMNPFADAVATRLNTVNSQSGGAGTVNIVMNNTIRETADFKKGITKIDRELQRRGYNLSYGRGGI